MSDIRTAAQREWDGRHPKEFVGWRTGRLDFSDGAIWAAARVTPTREQLATIIDTHAEIDDGIQVYDAAEAVLALMQELAEGKK